MKYANLINIGLFQLTWFACVVGGALWGLTALCLMLGFSWRSGLLAADAVCAAVAAIVGVCLDTLWIQTGVLDFYGFAVAPLWIVMLWIGVGLSVNHGLAYFKARPMLGGALAAVSAPVCYLSGAALGAVSVPNPALLAAVSAAWFGVFWLGFAKFGTRRLGLSDADI